MFVHPRVANLLRRAHTIRQSDDEFGAVLTEFVDALWYWGNRGIFAAVVKKAPAN